MEICELDKLSQLEFKQKAFDHNLTYKKSVGFSEQIKFGVEIEALGSNFLNTMRKKRGVLYYCEPEFVPKEVYKKNKWVLTKESTLELEDGGRVYSNSNGDFILNYNDFYVWLNRKIESQGGEISSPILSDRAKDWRNVRRMLKYMKRHISNLRINYSCASQVHFDAGVFNQNPELLFSFMVLIAETEPVLVRFFNGEFVNLRSMADVWAKPFSEYFLKVLPDVKDMSSYKSMFEPFSNLDEGFFKSCYFDFFHVYSNHGKAANTIENRVPNGTLIPEIIQNNVMLTGFLMEYVISGKYDYERGIYNIKSGKNSSELSDDMAFYVADMLPRDELKLDFLTQYYKDGLTSDSKTLVKSSRIFY